MMTTSPTRISALLRRKNSLVPYKKLPPPPPRLSAAISSRVFLASFFRWLLWLCYFRLSPPSSSSPVRSFGIASWRKLKTDQGLLLLLPFAFTYSTRPWKLSILLRKEALLPSLVCVQQKSSRYCLAGESLSLHPFSPTTHIFCNIAIS